MYNAGISLRREGPDRIAPLVLGTVVKVKTI